MHSVSQIKGFFLKKKVSHRNVSVVLGAAESQVWFTDHLHYKEASAGGVIQNAVSWIIRLRRDLENQWRKKKKKKVEIISKRTTIDLGTYPAFSQQKFIEIRKKDYYLLYCNIMASFWIECFVRPAHLQLNKEQDISNFDVMVGEIQP